MTVSASPCATSTGTPASRPGSIGTPASNGSVPSRIAAPAHRRRVGEQQPAGERRAAAEADEQHRVPAALGVEPGPEPGHRLGERLRDRSADAAVGEPGVAAALGDRRPHRGVGQVLRQVVGERRDLLLVRPAAVQQDDERRVRVGRAAVRRRPLAERRHSRRPRRSGPPYGVRPSAAPRRPGRAARRERRSRTRPRTRGAASTSPRTRCRPGRRRRRSWWRRGWTRR